MQDPLDKRHQRKLENARKALLRMNYEEDELKTLFKTDEELLAFYLETKKAARGEEPKGSTELEEDDEDEKEPEDSFKLSETEERVLERQQKTEAAASRHEKITAEKELFAASTTPPKNMDPDEKVVSYDDFLKSIEEGMSGDDSEVPNN